MTEEDLLDLKNRILSLEERQELTAIELAELRQAMDTFSTNSIKFIENQEIMMKENREMLDIYKSFKASIRIFGWVEKAAVWVTKIAAALGLGWLLFKVGAIEAVKGHKGG